MKTKRLAWHVDQQHREEYRDDAFDGSPAELEWLTTSDIAAELNVSVAVARDLIVHGNLPARREIDGSYRVERLLDERWLQRQYAATREFVAAQPFPAHNRQG